ncbi:vesicle-associated membrane protein 722-like isoform X1 [Syzygium oleosum]|uniref:vesicle-associated membrane protein 722-like isoform X1 n=1 Tax=Syzygium oleosum TaxID=219896 RepID=UPI0024B8B653|nr:vesicle-associated membrane protein 722-like isoform X1 [Syzygium oleosum]
MRNWRVTLDLCRSVMEVLDRGEEFEPLVDKKENLPSPVSNLLHAQDFRQQGNQMRRKLWLRNMPVNLIVVGTVVVLGTVVALILIIVLSICGGFKC